MEGVIVAGENHTFIVEARLPVGQGHGPVKKIWLVLAKDCDSAVAKVRDSANHDEIEIPKWHALIAEPLEWEQEVVELL